MFVRLVPVYTNALKELGGSSPTARCSRAASLFSSLKMTRNKIRGAYIVSIDGEEVFTKDDVERVLKRLFDKQATEF